MFFIWTSMFLNVSFQCLNSSCPGRECSRTAWSPHPQEANVRKMVQKKTLFCLSIFERTFWIQWSADSWLFCIQLAQTNLVAMPLDDLDEDQANELFARLDWQSRGYLGAGQVLRVLCSDIFAQRPNAAQAVAAASVRAAGGRLYKDVFVQAVASRRSSILTSSDASMTSSGDEFVPTLRVKLSDLMETAAPQSWSRPTTSSCLHCSHCGSVKDDQLPNSGAALEEWSSRQFVNSLRVHKAPSSGNWPGKYRAMAGSEPGLCDACGCCMECQGPEAAQRTAGRRRSVSRQSWQDSLRSPAGWHYLDFSPEPSLPCRSYRPRWRKGTEESWSSDIFGLKFDYFFRTGLLDCPRPSFLLP